MAVLSNNVIAGASIADDAAGGDAYQIEKSLRFNRPDTPYLEQTCKEGNRRQWTWSGWIKKTDLTNSQTLFSGKVGNGTSVAGSLEVRILSGTQLYISFCESNGTSLQWSAENQAFYRDPSAWQHWVIVLDTPNATANDRFRVYVNGKKVEDWGTRNTVTQNFEYGINKSDASHVIGAHYSGDNITEHFNGYFSDVHFIDGLALSPAAFGSFDSTGVWNPKAFALPAPNDDTTWSGQVSGNWYSTYNATKAFDGDIASWSIPADGEDVTWTPTSTINATSIRVKIEKNGSGGAFKQNGNDITHLVATGWVELPERTLSELIWGSNSSGNQVRISAIEVDGVILVDGQTDPTTRDNPNNGTEWKNSSYNSGGDSNNYYKIFDGDNSDWMNLTNAASPYTFTPPAGIPIKSLRLLVENDTTFTCALNGGSAVSYPTPNLRYVPIDLADHSNITTLTSIALSSAAGGTGMAVRAIEINGQQLVSQTVDNSFHLKFNDTSSNAALGYDSFGASKDLSSATSKSLNGYPILKTNRTGTTTETGYRTDDNASTLVLALPLDSSNGVADVHGSATSGSNLTNDAESGSANSTTKSKWYGSSRYFGSGDYIDYNDTSLAFGTGDFTVEGWFYWDDAYSGGGVQNRNYLWDMQESGGSAANAYQRMFLDGTGGSTAHLYTMDDDGSDSALSVWSAFPKNEWVHVAQVRTSGTIKTYCNGVERHSHTFSTNINAGQLTIGSTEHGGFGSWSGYIQDIKVYTSAVYSGGFNPGALPNDFTVNNLSANDGAVTIANADTKCLPFYQTTGDQGGTKNSPTAYNTDSNSSNLELALPGDVLTDEHDNVNTGSSARTITNSSVTVSTDNSRFYGSSLKFSNSSTTHLEVGAHADLGFDGAFTIEMWYYIESDSGFNTPICSKNYSVSGSNGNWYLACYSGSTNNFQFYSYDGTSNGQYLYSSGNIKSQTWHHIAVTRDGNNKTTLWVDGTDVGNNTSITRNLSDGASNGLMIGGLRNNGSWQANGRHGGYIQDLKIYKGVAKYTSNFTPPSLSDPIGVDSLTDTPTNYGTDTGAGGEVRGNYCTWNPLDRIDTTNVLLTEGNLKIQTPGHTTSATAYGTTRGTIGVTKGKWYWEIDGYTQHGSTGTMLTGVIETEGGLPTTVGDGGNSISYSASDGKKRVDNGTGVTYGDTYTTGDVIGVALDMDNGAIYFSKNGTWQASGVPTSGASRTNAAATWTAGTKSYTPGISDFQEGSGRYITAHLNPGNRAYKYTAPSGFKALCTQNLDDTFSGDELNNPSKYFDIKLWSGDGVDGRGVRGWNFGPDFLWMKSRNTAISHILQDTVRGVGSTLDADNSDAEGTGTGYVKSFESDGFDLEGSGGGNTSGRTYVGWGWDAGTTASGANNDGSINISSGNQWKNATAGFSITKYTGTQSLDTIGHGLNAKPDFIITKNLDTGGSSWFTYHSGIGATGLLLLDDNTQNQTHADWWNNTEPTNSVFTVNVKEDNNGDGDNHMAYCWTAIPGYSAFGKYTGTGTSTGPMVYCGFSPKWILTKNIDSSTNWTIFDTERDVDNVAENWLEANLTSEDQTHANVKIDILSNGFKLRGSDSGINASAAYIYAAFAEHPFKTARAR